MSAKSLESRPSEDYCLATMSHDNPPEKQKHLRGKAGFGVICQLYKLACQLYQKSGLAKEERPALA